jgi:hypothetical protein
MLVGGADEGSLAKAQYFKGKFIASDLLYVLHLWTFKTPIFTELKKSKNVKRCKHVIDPIGPSPTIAIFIFL